jgi:hypothetical protein
MTVSELIQKLSEMDGNKTVYLSPVISMSELTSVEEEVKHSPYDQDFDERIVVLG